MYLHMGYVRNPKKYMWENLQGNNQNYEVTVGMWGYGLDGAGLGLGQVAITCECGNELSVSIKWGEFLD